jgi:outer membrane lipoprotein-sorting protein
MRKVEFYDKKDRLLKVMTIPEIRKDGDYWTILKMEMENVQKPHRTTLEVSDLSYDSGIEDSFFTERYLKRAR